MLPCCLFMTLIFGGSFLCKEAIKNLSLKLISGKRTQQQIWQRPQWRSSRYNAPF